MTHDRLNRLTVADNRLIVSGKPLTDWLLNEQPHYIYSRDELRSRVQYLRGNLPPELKLHYAIKANPMPDVIAFMANLVDGLDVASAGELQLATQTNMAPNDISFAGPAKQISELEAAIAAGIVINVESPTELERIHVIAKRQGIKAKIALRVNPDFELKQSGMQMAGGAKPFGIDAEQIPALLPEIDARYIDLVGLHIFAGSQNLDSDAVIDAHRQTFELAAELILLIEAAELGSALAHVNIGGGLGIPYFAGQACIELEPIGAALQQLMARRSGRFAKLDIVMELGRYLVGEAGYYVCQITDIKQSRGKTYLLTNGGLHHHLSNSGNFGQVIRKNYPTLLADNVLEEHTESVEVAGPLCTPLDVVAAKIDLPKAAIGDFLVVLQSGAYGYSASPLGFLGHLPPTELLV